MSDLKSKIPLGNVNIDNVTFDIIEGRLSLTPKDDFYLINFWVKTKDSDSINDVFPPTIEILIKTKINLLGTNTLKLKMPTEIEAGTEWQVNYNTGYYDGTHQNFEDVKIEISNIDKDLYAVEFFGVTEYYNNVKGSCNLGLKDDLIPIW